MVESKARKARKNDTPEMAAAREELAELKRKRERAEVDEMFTKFENAIEEHKKREEKKVKNLKAVSWLVLIFTACICWGASAYDIGTYIVAIGAFYATILLYWNVFKNIFK